MSLLFSPIQIGPLTLKNRIAMSPMCQYSSVDGFANDWHLVHLGSRAVGGVGLIIQEATAVSPIGRISPDDLGIWEDAHIPFLQKIVSFVHAQEAKIGIQLAHAGRKASTSAIWKGNKVLDNDEGGWTTIAPSPIAFSDAYFKPEEMQPQDIINVQKEFVQAAERAIKAGYDVIELHAAHGYLIHEFLSPIANKRTDVYGGSYENRIRFLQEIVLQVKAILPAHVALFVRISAIDYLEDGWDIAQSIQLCQWMHESGVDLVDVSSGAIAGGEKIKANKNYQVPFAKEIKENSDIMVGAVGMIVDADQAETILQEGAADIILLGRELLRHPYFALEAITELEETPHYPNQYIRGFPKKLF